MQDGSTVDGPNLPHVVIRPSRGWIPLNLGELWRYRELLYFLVWRDVKVRYKQTSVGALWAIIQPLLLALLFTLIFSRIGKLKPPGSSIRALRVRRAVAVGAVRDRAE